MLGTSIIKKIYFVFCISKRSCQRRSTGRDPASKEPLCLSCHSQGHSVHATTTDNLVGCKEYKCYIDGRLSNEGHLDSKRNTHRADAEWDLARNRYFHKLAHLSDWQAKDVEDASVGKVEGPDEGLAMVGGRGWM